MTRMQPAFFYKNYLVNINDLMRVKLKGLQEIYAPLRTILECAPSNVPAGYYFEIFARKQFPQI